MSEVPEIEQTIEYGETSAIRRIYTDNPDDMRILEEIDRDPNRINWFESEPSRYMPKTKDELIDFANSDSAHLIYAVSGAEGNVPDEEVGKLQGWILIKPETAGHIEEMTSKRYVSENEAKNLIVEIEYAKRKDAAPGQMASAVRQTALHLAEISLQISEETPFPPPVTLTAFIKDEDPPNDSSIHVLLAAGFEEVGKVMFDDAMDKPDRFFKLNWQKLMDIERQKQEQIIEQKNEDSEYIIESSVFDKTPQAWDQIGNSAQEMVSSAFGPDFEGPVFGGNEGEVAYESLRDAFLSPDTSAITLLDPNTKKLIGFTLSMPIGRMYPERNGESSETSYIYFTVLDEEHRGSGLVSKLTDPLFVDLYQKGYKFAERDALIGNGYADKISQHYRESIIQSYDHNRFPEVGPERFFRIDIAKYLEQNPN